MNNIKEMISGVSPADNIPDLYFELYRMKYVISLLLSGKTQEEFEAIKEGAQDFAIALMKQKFPKLEFKLIEPEKKDE